MGNLDTLGRYVDKVIGKIIDSDDCIKLINPIPNENFELEDVLLGGDFRTTEFDTQTQTMKTITTTLQPYIYDFCYTVGTTTEDRIFVCVDTTCDYVTDNTFNTFYLHVYVFAPKTSNRLSAYTTPTKAEMESKGYYGNRVNMLCSAIDKLLNGDKTFSLGKLRPSSRGYVTNYIPNDKFYGRHLSYSVIGYNDDSEVTNGN